MTIKEIITRLEELAPKLGLRLWDNFGLELTSDFFADSWRGSYELPAIEVRLGVPTNVRNAIEN